MLRFTSHARAKMALLHEMGFHLTEEQVREAVKRPEEVTAGWGGRKVAQRAISRTHLLRVIYEGQGDNKVVITLYPARRSRYGG